MRPSPQLNMQDPITPHPGFRPLILILVDTFHAREGEERGERGLFGGLGLEEVDCRGGDEDAEGDGGVV